MVAHVRADRGTRDRDGRSHLDATGVVRRLAVLRAATPAMPGRQNERLRFALLPSQLFALHEVEGSVENGERAPIGLFVVVWPRPLLDLRCGPSARAETGKGEIVKRVESRNRIRRAHLARAVHCRAGRTVAWILRLAA